ncbi:MAG TPA: SDR family NAD(P)-dependent oxidoreductase [Myxococcota bacterium]
MDASSLAHQAIVITGASSGFGRGAALAFAEAGASLVLAARREALLEDLAAECETRGGRALAVRTDVSERAEVARLLEAAIAAFGGVDVWINNAGVAAIGPFERVPIEDHAQVIATDLLGALYGSWYAYRHFRARGAGTLINVASELGRYTAPYFASYAAAKHGVAALGEAMRQELAQTGLDDVHVCTVLPSAHDTPFFDHVANYTGHAIQPPRPLHDPTDVVETLVRLAIDPRDQEIVGADGIVKIVMKKLAPGLTSDVAARVMHRTQMEQAPPAADTSGAVHAPIETGTEVSVGRRAPGPA